MKYYEFDCGCKFPILENEEKVSNDGLPSLDIDFYNIPITCSKTWSTLFNADVTGCFQLESQLGKDWCKKLAPENEEDVSALSALLRPSCTKAYVDGKNMAQRYVDRKNGEEEYENFHKEAGDILDETYGIILYQEQAILISQKFAGFNLVEADLLRKSMGKKDASLMQEVKLKFIEGCEKTGIIDKSTAEGVFSIIEASNRYSFNKCLSPSTLVKRNNEYVELSDIKIGDKISSPYGETEVLNIYTNETELFEITLESGKTIECSIEHEFLCCDGKKHPLFEIISSNLKIMCESE